MTGTARIIQGNALALPLADASVDLVVTSPPYFGLRSYQDGGEHYAGQIGSEPTPAEFVDALIAATREMVRVLKPSGSIWVNLGDKYSQRTQSRRSSHQPGMFEGKFPEFSETWAERAKAGAVRMPKQNVTNAETGAHVPEKSLMGIPWRYALRCIDDLGLILRAEVIWSKPNGLPESVTDRVRRSHEQWFHMVKQPRYFSAVDEIREAHSQRTHDQHQIDVRAGLGMSLPGHRGAGADGRRERSSTPEPNPLGKLPGSVWTVATQPLTVPAELGIDHFAAFPMEWPRRIIQGWSPAGVCVACGEGRRPTTTTTTTTLTGWNDRVSGTGDPDGRVGFRKSNSHSITGYACACPPFGEPAPTRPAVILDPFGGTGTTALMAKALGRTGISIDMSADYCRLAEWRTTDPGQMAAALQIEKPEPINPNQLDLFGEVVA